MGEEPSREQVAGEGRGRAGLCRGQNAASQSALPPRFSGSEPGVLPLGRGSRCHRPPRLWGLDCVGRRLFHAAGAGTLEETISVRDRNGRAGQVGTKCDRRQRQRPGGRRLPVSLESVSRNRGGGGRSLIHE